MFSFHVLLSFALQLSNLAASIGNTDIPPPAPTPPPYIDNLQNRQADTNNLDIPTITLDALSRYFVTRGPSDPEPTADRIQIYPGGSYDDFPSDGVTIALGPDLRKRIFDAMGPDCAAQSTACIERIRPLIHNTDVSAHTKHFILVSAFLVGEIVSFITSALVVAAAAGGAALVATHNIKYDYEDMDAIHGIAEANVSTIAIQHEYNGVPTVFSIPPMPLATPPQDSGVDVRHFLMDTVDHKEGDWGFTIQESYRASIRHILDVVGIESVQKVCAGQDLFISSSNSNSRIHKRAPSDECLGAIERFVPDFVLSAPPGIFQSVGSNKRMYIYGKPRRIGFPTQGLWHGINTLVESALGLTFVSQALMSNNKLSLETVLPASSVTELKEDELKCPVDILCLADDCQAQDEDWDIKRRDAYCKTPENFACPCTRVHFPLHTDVQSGYIEAQYAWLEELLALSESATPAFDISCSGGLYQEASFATVFRAIIKQMCTSHKNLQDDLRPGGDDGSQVWFDRVDGAGTSWQFTWRVQRDVKQACAFDCETVFMAFADSGECVMDGGLMRSGQTQTECGLAIYNVIE